MMFRQFWGAKNPAPSFRNKKFLLKQSASIVERTSLTFLVVVSCFRLLPFLDFFFTFYSTADGEK